MFFTPSIKRLRNLLPGVLVPALMHAQFAPPRWIDEDTPGLVSSIATADLDGDGKQDLLMCAGGVVEYLPGNMPGMARPYRYIGVLAGGSAVSTADLDGDGDLDVLLNNTTGAEAALGVFENTEHGLLWVAKPPVAAETVAPYAVSDLDGDGRADLLIRGTGGLSWKKNLGGFLFGPAVVLQNTTNQYAGAVLHDPDGDGDKDIAYWVGTTLYHIQNNAGIFAPAAQLISGIPAFTGLADMDGDGDNDAVAIGATSVSWYARTGALSFNTTATTIATISRNGSDATGFMGDLDGDGRTDLLLAQPGTAFHCLWNRGGGTFAKLSALSGLGSTARIGRTALLDMDLDGDKDLVFIDGTESDAGGVAWKENKGTLGFGGLRPIVAYAPGDVDLVRHADMDGDGRMDVVFYASGTSTYLWARSLGNDFFAAPIPAPGPLPSSVHRFLDADGDGDADLITTTTTVGGVTTGTCILNSGNGNFSSTGINFVGNTPCCSINVAVDMDGDGDIDIAGRDCTGWAIWSNDGSAHFTRTHQCPSASSTIKGAADMDNDGDLDLYYATRSTAQSSSGGLYDIYRLQLGWVRNNGPGTMPLVSATYNVPNEWVAMPQTGPYYDLASGTAIDMDGDGVLDIAFPFSPIYEEYFGDRNAAGRIGWFKGSPTSISNVCRIAISAPGMTRYVTATTTADLDNDGLADIVTLPMIVRQEYPGVFTQAAAFPRSTGATDVIGDINGDGLTDITYVIGRSIAWWQVERGESDGVTHALTRSIGRQFKQLVDRDGDADIDVLTSTGWLVNDGSAHFTRLELPALLTGTFTAERVVDLDNDGDRDLIVRNPVSAALYWMPGESGATFGVPRPIQAGTLASRVSLIADVDGNGYQDIFMYFGNGTGGGTFYSYVLKNMGGGVFQKSSLNITDIPHDFADIDNDGDLDMVTVQTNVFTYYVKVYKNNGQGQFTSFFSTGQLTNYPAACFGDPDGDGDKDLVIGQGGIRYYPMQANGSYTTYTTMSGAPGANSWSMIRSADEQGDGDQDLFALAGDKGIQALNLGGGNFSYSTAPSGLSVASSGDFADLDGDGITDHFGAARVDESVVDGDERFFVSKGIRGSSRLRVRVLPGGCYEATTGHLNDALRSAALLPATEPYTALGVALPGGGGEHVEPARLAAIGSDAPVDWVVVELRNAAHPEQVVAACSALIQRDGDVVGTDGAPDLQLHAVPGSYHIAVRHRNHLGVMTAAPIALTATTSTQIDFTLPATATYGTEAQKNVGGKMVLWPGNVNSDDRIKYIGAANDRDPVLGRVGGNVPTAVATGYYREDVNMDGAVKYIGAANDRDIILNSVGGNVPTAVRVGQVP